MTTNPLRALPEEPASRSTLKPILITMLCSFLVAGGSCFGALRTFEEESRGGWWGFFTPCLWRGCSSRFGSADQNGTINTLESFNRRRGICVSNHFRRCSKLDV